MRRGEEGRRSDRQIGRKVGRREDGGVWFGGSFQFRDHLGWRWNGKIKDGTNQ